MKFTFKHKIHTWIYIIPDKANACDLLRPVQNTKPLRSLKYTPKYTWNSLPKPKYEQNYEKIRKPPIFVYFSYFFRILVSGRDSGCILGCILGSEGFCILYGAQEIASQCHQTKPSITSLKSILKIKLYVPGM